MSLALRSQRRRRPLGTALAPRWAPTLILLLGCATPALGQVDGRPEPVRAIAAQGYEGYATRDTLGRTIEYYLTVASETPLPLAVFVHGSGAGSLFVQRRDRVVGTYGHRTVRDAFAERARVLLVEKPGVDFLSNPGSVREAAPAFHREHTLARWSAAIGAAITAACRRSDVDCKAGVLVMGHSEGGVSAARVAATHPLVTHAAILAGSGPSLLYTLLTHGRAGEFFSEQGDTPAARERYLLEQWARILDEPHRTDRFFFGHPYRRWSTFQTTSPAEQLEGFGGPVFVAQGTADRAVDPASADMLFATLISRGQPSCLYRMVDADHSFVLPEGDGWRSLFDALAAWFPTSSPPSDESVRCFLHNETRGDGGD